MWPNKLDLSKNECRAKLRNYELGAYASVMDAFRAQGQLSVDKLKILKELRVAFNISEERHKAEARRVANDERLATVADTTMGYETYREWAREGRRAIPLLPRGIPETALIKVADGLSQKMTELNSTLPRPEDTERTRASEDAVPFYEERPKPESVSPHPQKKLGEISEHFNTWSRKRRSAAESFSLDQHLYPNISRAQSSGWKGIKKQKQKKAKQLASPMLPFSKPSVPESYLEEQALKQSQSFKSGLNRIIHSYASNLESPRPVSVPPPQLQQTFVQQPPKEPKVHIISDEAVKIFPTSAFRNVPTKSSSIKIVQQQTSSPGKLVLRPLQSHEPLESFNKIAFQNKGLATTIATAKMVEGDVSGPSRDKFQSNPVVQIVNTNGSLPSVKPELVRSISIPRSSNLGTIKLDAAQLKCLRIISVPTSSSGISLTQQKSPITSIKLLKNSRIHPTNSNGTTTFLSPFRLHRPNEPTDLKHQTLSEVQEKELERLSYEDIIEEDTGELSDDSDKTMSQEEEMSDVEPMNCVGEKFLLEPKGDARMEDKLSQLTKDIIGGKNV